MLKHPLITHLAAVLVGVAASMGILLASGVGTAAPDETGDVGELTAGTGGYAITGQLVGVADAPLTIEVWADYQCPYCGLFTHGIESTLLREYVATGKASLRFRDYAFLGTESTMAAVGARCAEREGAYWRYHDLLYASQNGENQGAFATENLVKLAEFAGLDTTAFAACLGDPAMAAAVAAETKQGAVLGVESTPTVRIVGPAGVKTLKGLAPLETMTAAIEAVARGEVDGSAGTEDAGPESTSGSAP